jgi:hypothetical protein
MVDNTADFEVARWEEDHGITKRATSIAIFVLYCFGVEEVAALGNREIEHVPSRKPTPG